jgi:hypothetical protein
MNSPGIDLLWAEPRLIVEFDRFDGRDLVDRKKAAPVSRQGPGQTFSGLGF